MGIFFGGRGKEGGHENVLERKEGVGSEGGMRDGSNILGGVKRKDTRGMRESGNIREK